METENSGFINRNYRTINRAVVIFTFFLTGVSILWLAFGSRLLLALPELGLSAQFGAYWASPLNQVLSFGGWAMALAFGALLLRNRFAAVYFLAGGYALAILDQVLNASFYLERMVAERSSLGPLVLAFLVPPACIIWLAILRKRRLLK